MMKVKVSYPSRDQEREIVERQTASKLARADAVVKPEDILSARTVVQKVYVDEKIKDYVLDIVTTTRNPKGEGLDELGDFIEYGCSPRASIALIMAGRAHAFLKHRGFVTPEDIKAIGPDVLRHRVILTYEAEAEEVSTEDVVKRIFDAVEIP
jgi:MoxR-like ATPase